MEPDHYLIWLYFEVEALFADVIGERRLRSRGFAPALTDVELLTIELFSEFQGHDSDKGIWRYMHNHWLDWFPDLGSYKNWPKRDKGAKSTTQILDLIPHTHDGLSACFHVPGYGLNTQTFSKFIFHFFFLIIVKRWRCKTRPR